MVDNLPPLLRVAGGNLVAGLTKVSARTYPTDSAEFFTETLGLALWDKQQAILDSVRDNRYTAVEAGKGVGKSIAVAGLVCWWVMTYSPATVITLSPSWANVINVIWRYIQQMHRDADLPGKVLDTAKWSLSAERFALGLSPRHDKPEDVAAFQSYHSPNLLVILDEAPGFTRLVFEAAMGMAVSENNKIVAIGNPISGSDAFSAACNSETWNHIHISSLDHPNVQTGQTIVPGAITRRWVEDAIKDHCVKTDTEAQEGFEYPPGSGQWYLPDGYFESFVLGRVPKEGSDQLIPLAWAINATTWRAVGTGEIVIGLDPSRVPHGDAAAMAARRGNEMLWIKRRRTRTNDPTGEIAGWLKQEMRDLGATRAFVDEGGLGGGVVDAARQLGVPTIAVNFGSHATHRTRFANRRTECWWAVRDALQGGSLSLVDDDLLVGDLTSPKFFPDRLGRHLLEPKDAIRQRLGRSPDSGDALALSFALPDAGMLDQAQRQDLAKGLKERPEEQMSRWTGGTLVVGERSGGRWRRG